MSRRGSTIRRAMNAHTDLHFFDAIAVLTESHFRGDKRSVAAASKIRAICKLQCARLLRVMDEAEAQCADPGAEP